MNNGRLMTYKGLVANAVRHDGMSACVTVMSVAINEGSRSGQHTGTSRDFEIWSQAHTSQASPGKLGERFFPPMVDRPRTHRVDSLRERNPTAIPPVGAVRTVSPGHCGLPFVQRQHFE